MHPKVVKSHQLFLSDPTMNEGPRTITESSELIRRGELTPSALLEQCLARIDRYESKVRAWVYLDRKGAREQAQRLTNELKQGNCRGPLHGIPIGIKDIIDVFDMPTGCGSKLWANSYARRDATCVERLRQAGAIIMGKTVTTTFASFDPSITRNPWNLERTPGGSSSGSAAAVACGMCLGALASQTGGSITRPASYCGVCSLKPSYGRVSVDGVLPLAPSLDHVGAMANCVRDLAILLQPIALTDEKAPLPYHYLNELDQENYQRDRWVASLPDFLPGKADSEMIASFTSFKEKTKISDWTWNDLPLPPSFGDVPEFHHTLMAVEAAAYHAERFRHHPDDYPPKITELIEHGLATPAPHFSRVIAHLNAFRDEIERAFVDGRNTFITPATTGPAPTRETTGSPAFNSPWSYAGLPVVSIPFAWSREQLPLSIQIVGRRWCEDDLFCVASMLEETIAFSRREPAF
jgi:Asp-tRNA(Asn)/Glu-tRNA(Gln) amidotransferase A subunit family amidase